MRKIHEIKDPSSCLNKSRENEIIFVLCARDPASPETIRQWCNRRLLLGLNLLNDEKIQSALQIASQMEKER